MNVFRVDVALIVIRTEASWSKTGVAILLDRAHPWKAVGRSLRLFNMGVTGGEHILHLADAVALTIL